MMSVFLSVCLIDSFYRYGRFECFLWSPIFCCLIAFIFLIDLTDSASLDCADLFRGFQVIDLYVLVISI